jgi:precorrin-2 dehydrogenase/sirohydrochlorin ferrochelatase
MEKRRKRPSHYYPLFLDLQHRETVVVGGGQVAERKVKALLDCQARVKLISPKVTSGLRKLTRLKQIQWHRRTFRKGDLRGASLVFATTNDPKVNHRIASIARKRHQPVNVANLPGESNFLVPSVVRRGNLLIAISTSGHSPALARKIRRELEHAFGHEYSRFTEMLGKVRQALMARISNQSQRKRILNQLIQSEVLDLLRAHSVAEAKKRIQQITNLGKKYF